MMRALVFFTGPDGKSARLGRCHLDVDASGAVKLPRFITVDTAPMNHPMVEGRQLLVKTITFQIKDDAVMPMVDVEWP